MDKYDYRLRDFEPGDIVWIDTPWLCCDFGCTQSIIEIVEIKYDKCKYFFKKLDHFAYYYKGNEGDVYEMPANTGCSPLATKSGKENEYWHEDYDKSQCVYGPESKMICMVCSAICQARYKDLIEKGVKVVSVDELIKQGIEGPLHWSDEQHAAYQCAYDLSNDWMKETPDWSDVEKAFQMGIDYHKNLIEKEKVNGGTETN